MVPFCVPNVIRHLVFGGPKRGPYIVLITTYILGALRCDLLNIAGSWRSVDAKDFGETNTKYPNLSEARSFEEKPNCNILHYVRRYSAILYYTILYYTILYYTIFHSCVLYASMLYYITLHYPTLHYITLHYTTFQYILLYYIILYHIIYITTLYSIILYYVVL